MNLFYIFLAIMSMHDSFSLFCAIIVLAELEAHPYESPKLLLLD